MERTEDTPTANSQLTLQMGGNSIADLLPAAIYTCDNNGIITYYNDAAAELWGRKPEIGKDLWCGSWKIYYPNGNIMPIDSCPMAITLKEKRAVMGEDIIVERPDGVKINVLPHPQPLFNEHGEMIGALNMLVDITDKMYNESLLRANEDKYRSLSELLEKKIEERTVTLKKSEERYHKMVEEVQDYAILLLNKDGYILNWNKGAEKIKGYTEAEIVGKNFRKFYPDKDREEKLPERLIKEASDTGRASHEGWRVRKDGSKFWGSVVITALHDESNEVIGFSKVTRDLTEKKLTEDRLNQYLKDIEFRNKQLEEYAYIASHDLQEPLRKIQIFAELLEDNLENPEQARKNLEKITSSAKRMSSLIKDVLKYSQLSAEDNLYTETDLNTVLETVLEDYSMLIEQKGVVVNHDRLPLVNGVSIQLHQLFSNLMSNALKFSSSNPVITIRSSIVKGSEEINPVLSPARQYLQILFSDNGIGFEQQYGEQIFKMFKRLSNTTGTGIGLALCKKIIENHSGHIQVESELGKGTTFTILLPLSK